MARYEEAVRAVERYGLKLFQEIPHLQAVGVGVLGDLPLSHAADDQFCIVGMVDRKLSERELSASRVQPFAVVSRALAEEASEASVETEVIESGGPLQPVVGSGKRRFHSLRCGISITNPVNEYPHADSAGTLGAFVHDGQGRLYLLSNNHVLAKVDTAPLGSPIVQPGTLDLTAAQKRAMPDLASLIGHLQIAELAAAVPIRMAQGSAPPLNRVDAAVARLTSGGRSLADIHRLGFGGRLRGMPPA